MKGILALLVVALCVTDTQAGPFRNRRAATGSSCGASDQSSSCSSAQSASACGTQQSVQSASACGKSATYTQFQTVSQQVSVPDTVVINGRVYQLVK